MEIDYSIENMKKKLQSARWWMDRILTLDGEPPEVIARERAACHIAIDQLVDIFEARAYLDDKREECLHWGALMIKESSFTNRSQFTNSLTELGMLDER